MSDQGTDYLVPRPSRRRLLGLGVGFGTAAFAGCLGGVDTNPAVTPVSTSDCTAAEPPEPTSAATPPRDYPETPARLTTETVRSFVAEFERAYQYNAELAEDPEKVGRLNELEVDVAETTVESDGSRFTASVSGDRYYRITTPDRTETPTREMTPLPMGRGSFSVSYVVTPESVTREETVVRCW